LEDRVTLEGCDTLELRRQGIENPSIVWGPSTEGSGIKLHELVDVCGSSIGEEVCLDIRLQLSIGARGKSGWNSRFEAITHVTLRLERENNVPSSSQSPGREVNRGAV
jgi:hypothetical protein